MNRLSSKKTAVVVFLLLITTIYASADYPTCLPGTTGDLGSTSSPSLTVTVNVASNEQTITGFGASDAWSIQFVGQWPSAKKEAIADWLFETNLDGSNNPQGIGLSSWRFNLGAGSSRQSNISDEWRRADTFLNSSYTGYDWTNLSGQRWFLQSAASHGVEYFTAFVNSPPINMTKNGMAYCDDSSGTTNLEDNKRDDFGVYLATILEHFSSVEGIDFDSVSPFNEPQWDWEGGQEGCRYATSDIAATVDEIYSEIQSEGLSTEIEIPESGTIEDLFQYESWQENYIWSFFNSSSSDYVSNKVSSRVAGHSYFTCWPDRLVEYREDLHSAINSYSGLQYASTEYCIYMPDSDWVPSEYRGYGDGRDLGIDPALWVARVMHFDLTVANAVSWDWWLAVSPYNYKDGLVYIDQNKTDGNYYDSKMLWAMGNYSRFVRPGMKRVNLSRSDGASDTSTVEDIMVSSYYDSTSGTVATVFINWTGSSKLVRLNYSNLPADKTVETIIPYVTSSSDDLEAYNALSVGETISIPRESIVTLVALTATPSEYCGDGTCDPDEDICNCPSDCGSYPSTETTCDDGEDEDCDGDIDCADSDCDYDVNCYVPDCGDLVCEDEYGEDSCNCSDDCGLPPAEVCDNGVSDDCDGDIDCDDSDCASDPACYVAECGTGICDPGEDECNCPSDCGAPASTETTCDDGDDDDCDGNTDCDDTDCDYDVNCYVVECGTGICDAGEDQCNCPSDCGTPPSIETTCDDGDDEDCDGNTDCDDTDCASDPACYVAYCGSGICDAGEDECNCPSDCGVPAVEVCDNGVSDDCDGDIDCDDSDCASDPACLYCGNGGDCDINDLLDMANAWLTSDAQWDIAPDGTVNYLDFGVLAETWTP